MNDVTPTRSLLIALADERRTMREGAAFLDEKCLVLAGAMLRELRRYRELARRSAALHGVAQMGTGTVVDLRHACEGGVRVVEGLGGEVGSVHGRGRGHRRVAVQSWLFHSAL